MLKADLHNKLADAADSEDVLTSNVLGALSYVPSSLVLVPWLRTAAPLVSDSPLLVPEDEDSVALHFWPRFANGREIDVVAIPRHSPPIGIECKYLSGKSSHGDDDQLADYLRELREERIKLPGVKAQWANTRLVYLTAAIDVRRDLEDSAQVFGPRGLYYGMRWQELPAIIDRALARPASAPHAALLADLRALLDQRGLRRFRGYQAIGMPPRWDLATWRRRWAFLAPDRARRPYCYRGGKHG